MKNGICGLTLKMRNKTKCGLRRAHLCILSKNIFERVGEEKKLGFWK